MGVKWRSNNETVAMFDSQYSSKIQKYRIERYETDENKYSQIKLKWSKAIKYTAGK